MNIASLLLTLAIAMSAVSTPEALRILAGSDTIRDPARLF